MAKVRPLVPLILVTLLIFFAACAVHKTELKSNALDFLYPKGSEAVPPTDVQLKLPVRVGIAFAPSLALM